MRNHRPAAFRAGPLLVLLGVLWLVPGSARGEGGDYCPRPLPGTCPEYLRWDFDRLNFVHDVLGDPGSLDGKKASREDLDQAISCLCRLVESHPWADLVDTTKEREWGPTHRKALDYVPYLYLAHAWFLKAKGASTDARKEACYRRVLSAAAMAAKQGHSVADAKNVLKVLTKRAASEVKVFEERRLQAEFQGLVQRAAGLGIRFREPEGSVAEKRKALVSAIEPVLQGERDAVVSAYGVAGVKLPPKVREACAVPAGDRADDPVAWLDRAEECGRQVAVAVEVLAPRRKELCEGRRAWEESLDDLRRLLPGGATAPVAPCPEVPAAGGADALARYAKSLKELDQDLQELQEKVANALLDERKRLSSLRDRWKKMSQDARQCSFSKTAGAIDGEVRAIEELLAKLDGKNDPAELLERLQDARRRDASWAGKQERAWSKTLRGELDELRKRYRDTFRDPAFARTPEGEEFPGYLQVACKQEKEWRRRYDELLTRNLDVLEKELQECNARLALARAISGGDEPREEVTGRRDPQLLKRALDRCRRARAKWEEAARLPGTVGWKDTIRDAIDAVDRARRLVDGLPADAVPATLSRAGLEKSRALLARLLSVLEAEGTAEILREAGIEVPRGTDGIDLDPEAVRGAAVRRLVGAEDPGTALEALERRAADFLGRASLARALAAYAAGDLDGAIRGLRALPVPRRAGSRARFARHVLLAWFLDLRARAFREQGLGPLAARLVDERDREIGAAAGLRDHYEKGTRGGIPWIFPAMRKLLESQAEVAREGAARGGKL